MTDADAMRSLTIWFFRTRAVAVVSRPGHEFDRRSPKCATVGDRAQRGARGEHGEMQALRALRLCVSFELQTDHNLKCSLVVMVMMSVFGLFAKGGGQCIAR